MKKTSNRNLMAVRVIAASLAAAPLANADVVTDWNGRANTLCAAAKLPPPAAYRTMAIVQTAAYEALNAVRRSQPAGQETGDADGGASLDAAIAAANHAALSKLVPSQQAEIDKEYQQAVAAVPDGPAKAAGLAAGEQAAAAVVRWRAEDGATAAEAYRPRTAAGVYVPTSLPAAPQWPHRRPWVMVRADDFRPGPPPRLGSERWARDFNEIRALGGRGSTRRSAMQTDIARFWEATGPAIYYGLVRSVAMAPGRERIENAKLLAAAGQAMDDALIAVFDAKYHYGFWRPVTAIRNGDKDGNPATQRDGSWLPLVETPMHPEYPCAHCALAGAVGAVLAAEIDTRSTPLLSTASSTAPGAVRSWTTVADFVEEVASARIYDGVHYRTSTEVGTALGKKVGERVVAEGPSRHPGVEAVSAVTTAR
jgi:hypothetical protein